MPKFKDLLDTFKEKAANTARGAGKFYLDNRDRIDAGMVAYPLAQNAARSAIAKSIASKTVMGVGAGALAVKAFPVFAAGAAVYYGPDLVNRAKNFMAQGEQVKKAAKGDFTSVRGLADQLAERLVKEDEEKPKADNDNGVIKAANDDRPPEPPSPDL